ncbi:uncharacterized protein A4U43_C01F24110 [Asparagus officinalis]|uniref:Uncharacterized protein n=1 Tax=Asparagus officinalis TaxID=4686 RepID=A0A5P1FU87_ASPOF|nr:uncharacterized protein A4U43_C01F24110 [Asparagus officinalis]
MDPSEEVPESVVQTISQKVKQELTKKFEEQKADLVHGFAEILTEILGQTIDPTAIARLIARTRSPEQGQTIDPTAIARLIARTRSPEQGGMMQGIPLWNGRFFLFTAPTAGKHLKIHDCCSLGDLFVVKI